MSQSSKHDTLVMDRLWQNYRKNRDPEIRNLIANANLGLIGSVRNKYFPGRSTEVQEDLWQEGFLGLLKAIDKFDPSIGAFSTYAYWWVRRYMDRWYKMQGPTIRLPVYVHDQIGQLAKGEEQFIAHHRRKPQNNQELADFLAVPVETVDRLKSSSSLRHVWELDRPIRGTQLKLGDLIGDGGKDSPLDLALAQLQTDITSPALLKALETLPWRVREMLMLRCNGFSLQEIGELLGITRERVRQLLDLALQRLRFHFGVDKDSTPPSNIEILEILGEDMLSTEIDIQLTEREYELACIVWPLLSNSPTKLDPQDLARKLKTTRANIYNLLGPLAEKGVINRGERGHYSRGTALVLVGNKLNKGEEPRLVSLERSGVNELGDRPKGLAKTEDPASKNSQSEVVPPVAPPVLEDRSPIGLSELDLAISRLETMKIEIDRRLNVLYEARKVLAEPL